jgi:WS/DGAT/MGAT family acyltransferase
VCGRLEHLPRFRRRVVSSPVHDPVWVDDRRFDIAHHVGRVSVPAPGGPRELRDVAGRLLSQRLDRRRPLWRMWIVDGLADGGFAIVGQAHHALVDGIAAIEVAMLLLDGDGDAPAALPVPWSAARTPALANRALATIGERVGTIGSLAATGLRVVGNPSAIASGISAVGRLSSALAPLRVAAPRTRLNRRIGPQRAVAFAEVPLEEARRVGREADATVNDVVLATATLAFGSYLRRGGERPQSFRVLVPVSVRSRGAEAELGNRISFLLVELPVAERNPMAVLESVRATMRAHKRAGHASVLDGVLDVAQLAPLPVRDAIAWVATRPQTFNAVVSNVPGPPTPLYMLGRRVRSAYPAVPLAQGHGVSVGMLSYNGTLHIGLYADPSVVPDTVELARDFTRSFDALRLGAPAMSERRRRRIAQRERARSLDERVRV